MAINDSIRQTLKDEFYSSPESFKEFALTWIDNASGFQSMFRGDIERKRYGEITLKLDEQSLRKIADAYAALQKAVVDAKVHRVPRLYIVK